MANLQGVVSKGITLGCKASTGSSYTTLEGLQEVPELGGEKEKIEITCLSDSAKRYTNGISDYGDLTFKFLYDNSSSTSNYRVLRGYEKSDEVVGFEISYPDGTKHQFTAQVGVKIDSANVNAALTFSLNLSLQSDITTADPS